MWLQFPLVPCALGFPRAVHTPALLPLPLPCPPFPVAFPFFPGSQVKEEKMRKERTQGNFLLLIVLFGEGKAVSFFFSFLSPGTSLCFLLFLLSSPPPPTFFLFFLKKSFPENLFLLI